MDTFLRLRRKFKFHKVKLTYRSLGRMSMYIFGTFVIASYIWAKFFPSSSEERYGALALKNYKLVETEISEKLKSNPENEKLWRLLVVLRVMAEQTPLKFNFDEMNPMSPEISSSGRQEFLYSKDEFMQFLELAKKPSPDLLKFRYRILKNRDYSNIEYHNRSIQELEEIGRIFRDTGQFDKALTVFNMVLEEDPENSFAKEMVFLCLTYQGKTEEVRKLLEDDKWRPYADHNTLFRYYLKEGNYAKMLYHLTIEEYNSYSWKALVTCSVAGIGWILFLVHLGSGWFWKRKEQLLIPIAFALGFISTLFCLGVVVVQDHYLNHQGFEGKSIIYNLAYSVLGIGLREEVCKLLFFLPLLYFIKDIKEDYKILCYCSLVGLGFAVEENFGYFMRYGQTTIMARFLTANFAHTFMTGFTCYYLVKAVQRGGHAWDDFTTTFLKMIGIHGIYDFFLSDPVMVAKGMPFFSMMIYVYVALLYLRLLMNTAPPAHQFVSLTRVFTIVLCCTIGVVFMMISSEAGMKIALKAIASGIVVYAIYAYMFYREFDEHIG